MSCVAFPGGGRTQEKKKRFSKKFRGSKGAGKQENIIHDHYKYNLKCI